MDTTRHRTRRQWLAACAGTAGVVGLAGCLGGGSDDGDDGDGPGNDDEPALDRQAGWAMTGGDRWNTSYAPEASGPTGDAETSWSFQGPHSEPRLYGRTTLVDGTVYVASGHGDCFAIDAATGEVDWETGSVHTTHSTCAVDDEFVYVPSNGGVHALAREDGSVAWSHEMDEAAGIPRDLTYHDGSLYWITHPSGSAEESGVATLERLDGEGAEAVELDSYWGGSESTRNPSAAPVVADGLVYVATAHEVRAVDAETGEREWLFEHDGPNYMNSQPVALGDGVVYATVRNGWDVESEADVGLYAIDAATGDLEWRLTEPISNPHAGVSYADGTVYVGGQQTHAVDPDGPDHRWSAPGESVPTIADGVVYVVTPDEALYGLDAASGEVVLEHAADGSAAIGAEQVAVEAGTNVLVHGLGNTVGIRGVSW